jgi:carbamoyl-phosphate synthase large subunit
VSARRRVLVTGTGGTGVGASVIQALQLDGGWDITAADAEPYSWGLYAADRGELVPWASDPAYLPRVAEVAKWHGAEAVIPGTEAETVLLADRRDEVPVPVIANRAALMPLMRDKRLAALRLADLGLPYIPSYSWDRRGMAAAQWGFPLVVKPMRDTSGSRGLHLVTSQRELDGLASWFATSAAHVAAEKMPDVQPYVGDPSAEFTVGVVTGADGTLFGSAVMRRELTGFTLHAAGACEGRRVAVSTGFSQGRLVRDELVQGFCEDLARRLDSRGPLNIQLRVQAGIPYVFEIHPRFSFSTGIRAAAGFNEPAMLLRHQLDGWTPDGPAACRTGVAAIRAFTHVLVPEQDVLS